MRKSLTKKVRFEVFKRDNFKCQYCGAKPPAIPLEVDHIIPVSKKGTNHIDNLITSCFDCNRGKSNVELSALPDTMITKIEIKKLALKQAKEFQKLIKQEQDFIQSQILNIEEIFVMSYKMYFSESFENSVINFINKLGFTEVYASMKIACARGIYKPEQVLKYFCGVCWGKIRDNE